MSLVRRFARPMLATVFVTGGLDALRNPSGRAQLAAPTLSRVAPQVGLPDDPELLVRANGAVMAAAGVMLATGRLPRVAGTMLAASLVPTTIVGHPFWEKSGPESAGDRIQFLKNLGLLGGVLLAAVDTEGRPGLSWRAKSAAKTARREAKATAKAARREARLAAAQAKLAVAS